MRRIEKTGASLNQGQKTELLRRWFTEHQRTNKEAKLARWEDDKPVAQWLDQLIKGDEGQVIKDNLKLMRLESMMTQFRILAKQMTEDELQEAGIYLAQQMNRSKKEEFAEALVKINNSAKEDGEDSEKEAEKSPDKQKTDDSSASENGETF